jgi:hypothetical protein
MSAAGKSRRCIAPIRWSTKRNLLSRARRKFPRLRHRPPYPRHMLAQSIRASAFSWIPRDSPPSTTRWPRARAPVGCRKCLQVIIFDPSRYCDPDPGDQRSVQPSLKLRASNHSMRSPTRRSPGAPVPKRSAVKDRKARLLFVGILHRARRNRQLPI